MLRNHPAGYFVLHERAYEAISIFECATARHAQVTQVFHEHGSAFPLVVRTNT